MSIIHEAERKHTICSKFKLYKTPDDAHGVRTISFINQNGNDVYVKLLPYDEILLNSFYMGSEQRLIARLARLGFYISLLPNSLWQFFDFLIFPNDYSTWQIQTPPPSDVLVYLVTSTIEDVNDVEL